MRRSLLLFILLTSLKINAQNIYFPPNGSSTWDTLSPSTLGWCKENIDSLYNFLDTNNTKAFIILKDGKIVLEKYFGTHTVTTPWQWASAGKTITAFMVGIAQQETFLSIHDTTSKYLGSGWTIAPSNKENLIKVRNQLCMTSGLDDNVPDHYCTLDTCLQYLADAGTRWAYHNGPYTLLDSVIESATGTTLNNYTTQKLKTPTGMTGSFFQVGFNNVFFSTARSMARFGILMQNNGNWNGNQIMTDTTYFNQMINTSQSLNLSYGYLWWLNGKASYKVPQSQITFNGSMNPDAPNDMYAAMGKDGQFLNVVPSQGLVMVRMGEAPNSSPVPFLLNNDIWKYINKLPCNPTSITDKTIKIGLRIYPNPSSGYLTIDASGQMREVEFINILGQVKQHAKVNNTKFELYNLKPGLYSLRISFDDGSIQHEKVMVNY